MDDNLLSELIRRNKVLQVPQDERPPEQGAAPLEHPAVSAYKQALGAAPKMSDYHPSRGREVLSRIAGALSGFGARDPVVGQQTQSLVRDSPFLRQQSQYNANLGRLGQAAELESGEKKSAVESAYKRAQTGAEGAREGYYKRHAETLETPEQKLERERVMHPFKPTIHFDPNRGMVIQDTPEGKLNVQQYAAPVDETAQENRKFEHQKELQGMRSASQMAVAKFHEQFRLDHRRDPNEKEASVFQKEHADQMVLQRMRQDPRFKDHIVADKDTHNLVMALPQTGGNIFGMGKSEDKGKKQEMQQEYEKAMQGILKSKPSYQLADDQDDESDDDIEVE